MRVHFLHQHVRDTVIILEEGNLPHPWCPLARHTGALEGPEWAARHHCSVCQGAGAEEAEFVRIGYEGERREGILGLRQAYGRPLAMVTSFKYLGRVLTLVDFNWPEVIGNLCKA